jgi:peptidoglycan/LPS O-acetylase OafA/YrhL
VSFSWIALITVAVGSYMMRGTPVLEVMMNLLLAWFIFRVAYLRLPKFNWMQRIPDLSYGIYIYHWCIIQILFYWMPNLGVIELFVLTFPITLVLAAMSWYIVEKPALNSKTRFANWMRNIGIKRPVSNQELLLD